MFFWEACPGATFVQYGKALINEAPYFYLARPGLGQGLAEYTLKKGYLVNPVNPVQENPSATSLAV